MSTPQISVRRRYCVHLAARLASYDFSSFSRLLARGLRRDKLPREFFAEVIIHCSLTVGFPAMLEGLGRLALLVPDAKPKSKRSNPKAGRAILESIYGDQSEKLLVNLKRLQPELPSWILQETYGRVFTRSGLSIQEREILNIVVLANQGLEKQLFSHLRGALRVGLKRRQIEVALTKTERLCGKNLKTSFEALATLAVR